MSTSWQVHFTETGETDLGALTKNIRNRVITKLEWLEAHFDAITPIALSHEWSDFYKLRVGDYRVIYRVDWDKQVIIVEAIDHRSKIYKR